MDTFVKGGERSLKVRAEDEQAVHEQELSAGAARQGGCDLPPTAGPLIVRVRGPTEPGKALHKDEPLGGRREGYPEL